MEGNTRRKATVWLMALLVTTATSLFAGAAAAPRAHAAANAQVTPYPIPTPSSSPQLMVSGPDGNLWFSEYAANQIGRITTAGVITEFPMPTANSGPFGIAVGPDNNLWFTELSPSKIAPITTSGTVTEYALPNSGSGPNLITAGPDGNLWFTEFYSNAIGRMTTTGSVAEFPTLGVEPSGIAAGRGNIWFTEYYSAAIGRMSTARTGVMEFPTPTPYSVPYGIAVGSNGAMWFAEYSGARVAQITTSGVATEFATPAGSQPVAVVPGADGNMWVTDASSNNAIDRLQIQSPCLDLHVRPTPNPVQPAASEAIGITLANCGAAGVSGLTTSTTVTPPSGCSAAPAIPDVTGDLAAGTSTAGGASFSTPTDSACFGTYAVSTQTTQASVVVASATASYAVMPCLTLQVTATPPAVDPGGNESVGISLANCGSIGLSGLTTSTTVTPPAGCGAGPAIPDMTADLAAGASTTGGGSFTAPTCLGTYALSTQTVQGSNVLASTTASYSVSLVAEYPTAGRPVGITSGSDGNLWFTADDGTVDSIDSAGHITPYPIPNNLFNAFRITWGPEMRCG